MRAKKFVCCLLAMLLLAGVSFISCGNSSKAKADSELTTQNGEDFKSFLDKFTSSAAFQYTRIKFPLKTRLLYWQMTAKPKKHSLSPRKNGRCWIAKP